MGVLRRLGRLLALVEAARGLRVSRIQRQGARGVGCPVGSATHRPGEQPDHGRRSTPTRRRPCGGCAPRSASSRSCGSSTTTTARARTTTSPSGETTRHPRRAGRISSPAARRGGRRPAGAGSDRAAAARRWLSSPGGRPRCAPPSPRGQGTSGRSPRLGSPTAPRAGRGHAGRAGCPAGRGGPPGSGMQIRTVNRPSTWLKGPVKVPQKEQCGPTPHPDARTGVRER